MVIEPARTLFRIPWLLYSVLLTVVGERRRRAVPSWCREVCCPLSGKRSGRCRLRCVPMIGERPLWMQGSILYPGDYKKTDFYRKAGLSAGSVKSRRNSVFPHA